MKFSLKILLGFAFYLCFSSADAQCGISLDNYAAVTAVGPTVNFPITVSNNVVNGLLLLQVDDNGVGGTVNFATDNGVSLTSIVSASAGGRTLSTLYLLSPPLGINNLSVSINASVTLIAGATDYSGVSQTAPSVWNTNSQRETNTSDFSISLSSTTFGSWIIDQFLWTDSSYAVTELGASQTQLWDTTSTAGNFGAEADYLISGNPTVQTLAYLLNNVSSGNLQAIEILPFNCSPTPTNTPANTFTETPTSTMTPTFTNSPTDTATYTLTQTGTNTATDTPTNTPTETNTPQPRLILSWNDLPVSHNYEFNEQNVTGIQVVLTAHGQEPVSLTQISFGLGGTLTSGEVVSGSVQLYPDTGTGGDDSSGGGLYSGNGSSLGSVTFTGGTATFSSGTGLVEITPGAPETLLLVFSLNAQGGENFYNTISASSIVASGADTGTPALIFGGPINGNTHTVLAPTATVTTTDTATSTATNTATNTTTDTATDTLTNTATYTATNTPTDTATNSFTSTGTDTATNTATPTATTTATNSPTDTATYTLTQTGTNTATDTPTNTPTETNTPQPRLILSWNDLPASHNYEFNEQNVTGIQVVLTAHGQEPVSLTQISFGLGGTLTSGEVVSGSVQLYPDTGTGGDDSSGGGLYSGNGSSLGSVTFTGGTATFSSGTGLVEITPGAPETLLLVFSLNAQGGENFYNTISASSIVASGADTGTPALIFGGPINGNTHTVLAPTATVTTTDTATSTATNTATNTTTDTATDTLTNTATYTATNTPTDTATNSFTSTGTDTATNTATPTATTTATNSPTDTATYTLTQTGTNTATDTPTNTPTETNTPQPRLILSWNDLPVSHNYEFNEQNVTGIQVVLTAHGQEPVSLTQISFGLGGTLTSGEVVSGSVQLYPDTGTGGDDSSGGGLYSGNGSSLGSVTFTGGTATFSSGTGLVEITPGAPETLLLVFSLNAQGGENFYNTISASSIVASGADTGTPALIFGGPINGNTHTVLAPTATVTTTDTATSTATNTATNTTTDTATDTLTNTATYTATNTPTDTATNSFTSTGTDTATNTATPTATTTATNSPTDTATYTLTQTGTNTATDTPTNTPTETNTPQPRLILSWNDLPASHNYEFNEQNVTGIQVVLTAHGQEPVSLTQISFGLGGTLTSGEVVSGSVQLYPDTGTGGDDSSGGGLYSGNGSSLGSVTFTGGTATFSSGTGLVEITPGAPETLLLVFSLNAQGGENFYNTISASSIVASGADTGTPALIFGGPINGNTHTVLAPTATVTTTDTATSTATNTATNTTTDTATDTLTNTATYTATNTPTDTATNTTTNTATNTPTNTATYTATNTTTNTDTNTTTQTATNTATITVTNTATSTATNSPTVEVILSAHAPVLPSSQQYNFNESNVSSVQFILTSAAQENVLVKQLSFSGGGNLVWENDVAVDSVGLYKDNDPSAGGLYDPSDTLIQGGQDFNSSGSVTFVNLPGLVTLAPGVPQTFLMIFSLNDGASTNLDFNNAIASLSIVAVGASTGQGAQVTGSSVMGNTHTVTAATPTATNSATNTATNTATNSATNTTTNTATNTTTNTATNTPTNTATYTATNTTTNTDTNTTTQTATNTATITVTNTATSTATNSPTVEVILSTHAPVLPSSQQYNFNESNVSSVQFILTSAAQENVLVKQLSFSGGGNLVWENDVAVDSVGLYKDNDPSAGGLYDPSDTLIQGGQDFNSSGSVTFVNLPGLVTLAPGVPQTFLMIFSLNDGASTNLDFNNAIASLSIVAVGASTGQGAQVTGSSVMGNTHTVTAATPTATNSATNTATNTATNSATNTTTNTATNTTTNTATNTPTNTATYTATNTTTNTDTNTTTQTATNTATITVTNTATSTATNSPTVEVILSAHAPVLPSSQQYNFNESNVSSVQFILTSAAQENVLVKQLSFSGGGNLVWENDVAVDSVGLYKDNDPSAGGLYDPSDTLIQGGQDFNSSGSVTFVNLPGLVTLAPGVPQTFLMIFSLNDGASTNLDFNNAIASLSIVAVGASTGQGAQVTGSSVMGNTHTVTAATPTATNSATNTATNTATNSATNTTTDTATNTTTPTTTNSATITPTNTPTNTSTNSATYTTTNSPTNTATSTFTPLPPDHLVFLNGSGMSVTAGNPTGPITIQVQNSQNTPMAFQSNVNLNLMSSSDGDYSYISSGAAVTSVTLPAGSFDQAVDFMGYKSESVTLIVSAVAAIATPVVEEPVTVQASSYYQLQVLIPNQVSDPGKPISNASGLIGLPNSIEAGNYINATVNAVDKYFNLVTAVQDPMTLTSTDPAVPSEGPATLVGGVATPAVIFLTQGSRTLSARDLNGGETGTSDPITILQGVNSTLLNVVHTSPQLSTVVYGEKGVKVFTFNLTVQQGSHNIQINSLTIDGQNQAGSGVAMDSAFQDLVLSGPSTVISQPITLTVSSSNLTSATFDNPITVNSSTSLPLTVTADVLSSVSANTVKLVLEKNGINAYDAVVGVGSIVGLTSFGDPTGFPMNSEVMLFEQGNVSSTYGNYPNPFHAGNENTTIEFNLQSSSNVTLVLYDVMGDKVITLLNNQTLNPGLQRISWDGRNGSGELVLNGVYYAQLNVNGAQYMLKIAVVK